MMPLVVHDFITGRPFRAKVLDEFLPYAKQLEGWSSPAMTNWLVG